MFLRGFIQGGRGKLQIANYRLQIGILGEVFGISL